MAMAMEATDDNKAASSSVDKAAKKRKKKLSQAANEEEALLAKPIMISVPAVSPKPLMPPFSFDAKSLHMNLPLGKAWLQPRLWVCFTDLHLSEKTEKTCIEVLKFAHLEAAKRSAGIVFLGDFWDERGSLPVEPLNAVLREISTWSQPCLFLVGNHDQVDLGGTSHSLTPLKSARPDLIHVFESPALFRGALWLPYRRDKRIIEAAIAAAGSSSPSLKAVMAHADMETARYNYAIQARSGLNADIFPPRVPVYTGHYHIPHTVPDTAITYIGSCYQVTAAEAGESKRMVVFDAEDGWKLIEEIPISLGPRHIRVSSMDELESSSLELRAGDRLKVMLSESSSSPDNLDPAEMSKRLGLTRSALESRGVKVEVSMAKKGSDLPRITEAEDKGPDELLSEYAQRSRMSDLALCAARKALGDELAEGGRAGGGVAASSVKLEMGMVEIEGWGPFREVTRYDLSSRGLRVITGQNEDDGGSDSNGSGKTCLVTAPLWCLTGDMLSRSETGSSSSLAIDAMLNDGSKKGRVRLEGIVNGLAFMVEREVKKGATSNLSFTLDGKPQDKQDKKTTQKLMHDHFNTELLRLSVFFGQNDITQLLTAEDAALKEILRKVVETDVWELSQDRIKADQKVAMKEMDQSDGRLSLLTKQRPGIEQGLIKVREDSTSWAATRSAKLQQCVVELEALEQESSRASSRIQLLGHSLARGLESLRSWSEDLELKIEEAEDVLSSLEAQLESLSSSPPAIPVPLCLQASTDEGASKGNEDTTPINMDEISAEVHQRFFCKFTEAEAQLLAAERSVREALDDAAGQKAKYNVLRSRIKQASLPPSSHNHESAIFCDKCLMEVDANQHSQQLHEMTRELDDIEAMMKVFALSVKECESQKASAKEALGRLKKEEEMEIKVKFELESQARDEERLLESQALDAATRERDRAMSSALSKWRNEQSAASKAWEASLNGLGAKVREQTRAIQGIKERQQLYKATGKSLAAAISSARCHLASRDSDFRDDKEMEAGLSHQELASMLLRKASDVSQILSEQQSLEQQSQILSIRRLAFLDEENPFSRQLTTLEKQLSDLADDISGLSNSRSELQAHLIALDEAEKALGRGGIQAFVLEGVLKEWEERCRFYLELMADGTELELNATKLPSKSSKKDEIKEVITKVLKVRKADDGSLVHRSIHQLSGGERRRVAIALSLGFSDLVRCRGRLNSNVLVLDEVLQQLDSEGCSRVATLLKCLHHKTILVVGQKGSFVENSFDVLDRVVKVGGISVVLEQE